MRYACSSILLTATLFAAGTRSGEVTFHRDVTPVLQRHCQSCHRPGEAAPMSFVSYTETRPWAKAMREAVRLKRMPPWHADPHVGKFSNDRSMPQADIDTLTRWAETGAVEGNPADAPPPVNWTEGWNIGTPDYIVEMPTEYHVPAQGTIEYTYFVMPSGFKEDRWVQMAEVRPGNRRVVHHVIAFVREPGSKWLPNAMPGVPYVPKKGSPGSSNNGGQWLVGYAPGTVPDVLEPGQARLVKAGSDIVLQMHYTASGKEEADRTKIGFIFAKQPPTKRVFTLASATNEFVIPAGAPNHRVDAEITLDREMWMTEMLPHMHLRGKAFEFRVAWPDGREETILRVPKYDFNWQLTYKLDTPLRLTKGTKIRCTAWYDNSPNNPSNPDPKVDVREGEQSWDEMMIGFFNVAFDPAVEPASLVFRPERKPARGRTSTGE